MLDESIHFFTDIDECAVGSHNCHATYGQCSNTIGSFSCSCLYAQQGDGINCAGKDYSSLLFSGMIVLFVCLFSLCTHFLSEWHGLSLPYDKWLETSLVVWIKVLEMIW